MADADTLLQEIDALGDRLAQARASIARRFIGQDTVGRLTLAALPVRRPCASDALPGLGKTRWWTR